LASTRTASPKASLSAPEDAIVEVKPPEGAGFSGTAKLLKVAQAPLIAELLKRGYTIVNEGVIPHVDD
jgi:hypothetical protein